MARRSDRWITPPVVVGMLFCGTVVILAVIASVTFLTWRGLDPDPMIRLTAQVGAAVFSAGTFIQGLAQRRTTTNVERKTGQLEAAVAETLGELDARGRHGTVTIDPHTRPHPFGKGNGPRLPGEVSADQSASQPRDRGGRSE
jgi:hypothetical protein